MSDTSIYINGLCRCCHNHGCFKSLGVPYVIEDREEIYSVKIRETFDIILSPQSGESSASTYTICESCISSLQDAARFKQQVLSCEEKLTKVLLEEDLELKVEDIEDDVKNEFHEVGSSYDLVIDFKHESSGNIDSDLILETQNLNLQHKTLSATAIKNHKNTRRCISRKTRSAVVLAPDKEQSNTTIAKKYPRRIRKTKVMKDLSCKICNENFTAHGLKIHMKTHEAFTCYICRDDFTKYNELIKHIELTHMEGTSTYPCNGCNQVLNSAKLLQRHLTKHYNDEPVQCDECEKKIKRRGLASHMRVCHTKTFICDYCDKKFHAKNNLIRHIFRHTGKKPYICHVCGKSFTRSDIFKDHVALHSGEQPFKCNFCPKRFFVKQNRRTHERQHTEAKKFICKICGKPFHLKRSLKTHMVTHTGEKPFTCEVCNRPFQFKGTLKLHMRTHTGEKPFSCDICNKSFRQNQTLKSHIRMHTGEKAVSCELCNVSLASQKSLKVHMRRHTGEKDTCKVCNKQISNIYDHMKVHRRAVNKCV